MSAPRMSVLWQPKPREHWIDITQRMSGHFAVECWLNPDMGGFVEPWDTGIGRYETAREAYHEAKAWAEDENLPFIVRPEFEPRLDEIARQDRETFNARADRHGEDTGERDEA